VELVICRPAGTVISLPQVLRPKHPSSLLAVSVVQEQQREADHPPALSAVVDFFCTTE